MTNIASHRPLIRDRLRNAKKAYTTHRVPLEAIGTLIHEPRCAGDQVRPECGDLLLARVDRIGHHTKLELCSGRRATLNAGDEIIVCFGNRYAPDQFEALIGEDLSACHLAAAGGVAGNVRVHHERARQATRISPIGFLGDREGHRLNLRDFALPPCAPATALPTIAVVGTSMNAGKTTVVAQLVEGLVRAGFEVGAAKVTGTGAGGDRWQMADAGARDVLDFTDAGYASTYMISPREVQDLCVSLIGQLAAQGAGIAVIEIADGLLQRETRALISSQRFLDQVDHVVFAGTDSVGTVAGVQWLEALSLPLTAVSGLVTRSPLAVREVESWVQIPVLPTMSLSDPEVGARVWGDLAQRIDNPAGAAGDDRVIADRLAEIERRLAG